MGTALAARFSGATGRLDASSVERIVTHLRDMRLPIELAGLPGPIEAADLIAHMQHDKKRDGDTLPFILLDAIGRGVVDRDVELAAVEAFLKEELRS